MESMNFLIWLKIRGESVNEYSNPKYHQVILSMEKELLMWYISTSDCVPETEGLRSFVRKSGIFERKEWIG